MQARVEATQQGTTFVRKNVMSQYRLMVREAIDPLGWHALPPGHRHGHRDRGEERGVSCVLLLLLDLQLAVQVPVHLGAEGEAVELAAARDGVCARILKHEPVPYL